MNNRKKQITLQITTWKQLQNGLFDYRTDRFQEKYLFKSSILKLQLPPIDKPAFYIIHQPQTNDYEAINNGLRLERRKTLKSRWDKELLQKYKILGAFKIIHQKKKKHKGIIEQNQEQWHKKSIQNQVFIQAFLAQSIKDFDQKEKISKTRPYWVVRSLQNWTLKKNQVLKFGRLQLKIIDLSTDKNINQPDDEYILNVDSKIEASQLEMAEKDEQQKKCRVCFYTQAQAQDPKNILINPCKCKGSIKYIHVDCLKKWLSNRLTKVSLQRNGDMKIADKECCQVCKAKYPHKIQKQGKIIPLLNFLNQDSHFVCFQPAGDNVFDERFDKFYLSFYEESSVRIGRLQEQNGLLLTDQTVSRKHACIELVNEQYFTLKDLQSKYGTLAYEQGLQVQIGKKIRAFQIQNSVFAFQYR